MLLYPLDAGLCLYRDRYVMSIIEAGYIQCGLAEDSGTVDHDVCLGVLSVLCTSVMCVCVGVLDKNCLRV